MKRTKITEKRLIALGFEYEDLGEDPPYGWYKKDGVEVWNYNSECWLINMLDEAGINKEFHYMDELAAFFKACGLEFNKTNNNG